MLSYGTFQDRQKAHDELHYWLKSAKTISKREDSKDASGTVVGERAVAVVVDSSSHEEFFSVTWTNGPDAWWAESTCLSAALFFENNIIYGKSLTTGETTDTK